MRADHRIQAKPGDSGLRVSFSQPGGYQVVRKSFFGLFEGFAHEVEKSLWWRRSALIHEKQRAAVDLWRRQKRSRRDFANGGHFEPVLDFHG
jgi:hypothetical protein